MIFLKIIVESKSSACKMPQHDGTASCFSCFRAMVPLSIWSCLNRRYPQKSLKPKSQSIPLVPLLDHLNPLSLMKVEAFAEIGGEAIGRRHCYLRATQGT
jgi:hypothetical protein